MPGVLVGVVLELTRFIDSLISLPDLSFELVLLGCRRTWHFPLHMCLIILGVYGGTLKST